MLADPPSPARRRTTSPNQISAMPRQAALMTRQNGVMTPCSTPYCTRNTPASASDRAAMARNQLARSHATELSRVSARNTKARGSLRSGTRSDPVEGGGGAASAVDLAATHGLSAVLAAAARAWATAGALGVSAGFDSSFRTRSSAVWSSWLRNASMRRSSSFIRPRMAMKAPPRIMTPNSARMPAMPLS